MNIAIVDDDIRECDKLSETIKEYAAQARLPLTLSVYHSAEEILASYRPYAFTAIFMDVYMDGMTGVDAARDILAADSHAIIIFLVYYHCIKNRIHVMPSHYPSFFPDAGKGSLT